MPFPDIDPVIFQIGPFALRWYALAYVAAFILGLVYVVRLIRTPTIWDERGPPITQQQADDLVLWITAGTILGGRLGYVLFYRPDLIWRDPIEILQIWNGGMAFHGGALGVIIAMLLFSRFVKAHPVSVADLVVPAVPIGLFLGRIANFINGELWGRPTDVPWGVVFPGAGAMPRHPSQLYEAALEGLVLFLILRWATHGAKLLPRRGVLSGLFLVGYGVFRITTEFFREPDVHMPHFPVGLTMGMILSVPMILFGLVLLAMARRGAAPAAVGARVNEPAGQA